MSSTPLLDKTRRGHVVTADALRELFREIVRAKGIEQKDVAEQVGIFDENLTRCLQSPDLSRAGQLLAVLEAVGLEVDVVFRIRKKPRIYKRLPQKRSLIKRIKP